MRQRCRDCMWLDLMQYWNVKGKICVLTLKCIIEKEQTRFNSKKCYFGPETFRQIKENKNEKNS